MNLRDWWERKEAMKEEIERILLKRLATYSSYQQLKQDAEKAAAEIAKLVELEIHEVKGELSGYYGKFMVEDELKIDQLEAQLAEIQEERRKLMRQISHSANVLSAWLDYHNKWNWGIPMQPGQAQEGQSVVKLTQEMLRIALSLKEKAAGYD